MRSHPASKLELGILPPSTILDIGAGTGNYSYELAEVGYKVIALEPSDTMRNQGKQHRNLKWIDGIAENIPLEDQTVNGIICTLASHHFRNPSLCYQEMNRVLKQNNGKIVIFTLDPRLCPKDLLILDYFGPVVEESYKVHPSINELSQLIEEQVRRPVNIRLFPLPYDLVDQFFFAGWRRPELYLDKDFQAVTSPLANGRKDIVTKVLSD